MFENVFKDELHWHMFNPDMSDVEIRAAMASIGVTVESIERPKNIIWVKGNEATIEIQQVLKNWSPLSDE